jgi:enoyl-CoA hydratase/carnithine racemase
MSEEIVNTPRTPSDLVLCKTDQQGVFLLELNRPEKLNALNKQLLKSLEALLRVAHSNPQVHCVVLTGSQKSFSVGADIHDFAKRGLQSYLDRERLEGWRAIEQFSKPIIAAVNGYAIGGGAELAMICDVVIAGENAKFGQGEIAIGSIPGDGGTQRLPRFVGKSLAMQMILTGQTIDASQALRAGLVSEVTPSDQTVTRALEIARRIAALPTLAVQMAKEAVLKAFELPLSKGLAHERALVEKTFQTEDRAEGLKAFLEKRTPKFTGR